MILYKITRTKKNYLSTNHVQQIHKQLKFYIINTLSRNKLAVTIVIASLPLCRSLFKNMNHQTIDIELNDFSKYNITVSSLPNSALSPSPTISSTSQLIQTSQSESPVLILKHCLYRSSTFNKSAILLFHTPFPISLGKEYYCITIPSMPIKVHEILNFQGKYIFTRSTFKRQDTEFENVLIIPYNFLQLTRWQKIKAILYSWLCTSPILFEVSFLREVEENGKRVLQKSFILESNQ